MEEKINKDNSFIKDNWFKIAILVIIVIIASSIIGQQRREQVAQEQKAQQSIIEEEQKKQEEQANAILLQQCLADAETTFSYNWKLNCEDVARYIEKANSDWKKQCSGNAQVNYNECMVKYAPILGAETCQKYLTMGGLCDKTIGTPDYSLNCSLPKERADALNNLLKEAKDDCFKLYPT